MRSVFDAHVDTLLRVESTETFLNGSRRTQLDMPRAVEAGVTHLVTAVCAEAARDPEKALKVGFGNYMRVKDDSPVSLHLMLEGCETLLQAENRNAIMDELEVASLTWNGRNSLGGGIGTDLGLTGQGRDLALELREAGVLLDVSHLCDRSRKDLISMDLGVVATHCNCRALHDFPRNLPDQDLKEIAAGGGVIGITFVPDFLADDASIQDIVEHLEHLVELVGVGSAGFGSDFDGIRSLPNGVEDCGVWPELLDMLDRRGWSEEDISAVACENWLRVFNEA
jgi:membrane dipeptidase